MHAVQTIQSPIAAYACVRVAFRRIGIDVFAVKTYLTVLPQITLLPNVSRFDLVLFYISRAFNRLAGDSIRLIRYYFVAQPVPVAPTATHRRVGRFSIRRAHAVDAVIGSAPRPGAVLQRRFRDGAMCFVAECDGQLAGFIWLMERKYMEDEVRCLYHLDAESKAAWDFDVYVVPAFRATRLFARLWDAANEWLLGQGYRWSLSRISGFNVASLTAHQRLGAVTLGSGTFLTVGSMQIAFFSMQPYVHVSFRRKTFPQLTLSVGQGGLEKVAHA